MINYFFNIWSFITESLTSAPQNITTYFISPPYMWQIRHQHWYIPPPILLLFLPKNEFQSQPTWTLSWGSKFSQLLYYSHALTPCTKPKFLCGLQSYSNQPMPPQWFSLLGGYSPHPTLDLTLHIGQPLHGNVLFFLPRF